MDFKETAKIMAVLEVAYPRYYADTTTEKKKQAATLWATMLADYSYELVSNAVKVLIATNNFPPTIADVTEKIRLISEKPEMTELEAWSIVRKAICNSLYNSIEEFEKLPSDIQQVVHTPEQLKAWALMSEDEVNTVVASNFQRSFRAKRKQIREYEALPSDVRNFIEETFKDKFMLPKSKQTYDFFKGVRQ